MRPIVSAPLFVLLLASGGAAALAQSTLPPMSPTARPKAVELAHVTYAGGQLEIEAENSSLSQILREVAKETGIRITGTVTDEPVYGKFGPSKPAVVLASLLDGVASNMLFVQAQDTKAISELILTPRQDSADEAPRNLRTEQRQPRRVFVANADDDPSGATQLNEADLSAPTGAELAAPVDGDAAAQTVMAVTAPSAEIVYQRLQKLEGARVQGNSQ